MQVSPTLPGPKGHGDADEPCVAATVAALVGGGKPPPLAWSTRLRLACLNEPLRTWIRRAGRGARVAGGWALGLCAGGWRSGRAARLLWWVLVGGKVWAGRRTRAERGGGGDGRACGRRHWAPPGGGGAACLGSGWRHHIGARGVAVAAETGCTPCGLARPSECRCWPPTMRPVYHAATHG